MRVEYSRQAVRDIRRLPQSLKPRVKAAIEGIADNPLSGKKLQGPLRHRRSVRVGEYRIIYVYLQRPKELAIITISPRGGAYR